MEGTSQGHVTLVSKGRDNKTGSVTLVFVTISEASVCLFDEGFQRLVRGKWITICFSQLFPVVTELLLPRETVDVLNSLLDHILDHSLCMDIKHNEGSHEASLLLSKVTSDQGNHVLELLV
jgi:hypothetical protein